MYYLKPFTMLGDRVWWQDAAGHYVPGTVVRIEQHEEEELHVRVWGGEVVRINAAQVTQVG